MKDNNPYLLDKKGVKTYDKDKAMDYICEKVATSSRSVGRILAEAREEFGEFPGYSQVMKWMDENKDLADKYARAKEAQADWMADEMLDIADDGTNDWMKQKRGEYEVDVVDKEAIQRSRVRIDTRKWLASKLKPKKYGDKIVSEISGPDGGPIQVTGIDVAFVTPEKKGE